MHQRAFRWTWCTNTVLQLVILPLAHMIFMVLGVNFFNMKKFSVPEPVNTWCTGIVERIGSKLKISVSCPLNFHFNTTANLLLISPMRFTSWINTPVELTTHPLFRSISKLSFRFDFFVALHCSFSRIPVCSQELPSARLTSSTTPRAEQFRSATR